MLSSNDVASQLQLENEQQIQTVIFYLATIEYFHGDVHTSYPYGVIG